MREFGFRSVKRLLEWYVSICDWFGAFAPLAPATDGREASFMLCQAMLVWVNPKTNSWTPSFPAPFLSPIPSVSPEMLQWLHETNGGGASPTFSYDGANEDQMIAKVDVEKFLMMFNWRERMALLIYPVLGYEIAARFLGGIKLSKLRSLLKTPESSGSENKAMSNLLYRLEKILADNGYLDHRAESEFENDTVGGCFLVDV